MDTGNQIENTTIASNQLGITIFALSEQFAKANKFFEAITLLESIVQQTSKDTINDKNTNIKFSPLIIVKARLRIAELLLSFTENIEEAQSHLTKAMLLCGDAVSTIELQLKIMSHLIYIYHLKGAIHLEKQAILKGISLVSNSLSSIPNSVQWLQYFHLRMVGALRKDEANNIKEMLEHLNIGLELSRKIDDSNSQILFLLSKAQLHLIESRNTETRAILDEVNHILLSLANSFKSSNEVQDSLLKMHDGEEFSLQPNGSQESPTIEFSSLNYMRLHSYLITMLFHLKIGDVKSASNELIKVHECINMHESFLKQNPKLKFPYYWLTPINLYSLIYLLSAIIYKAADVNTARIMGTKGLDLVEANLSRELNTTGVVGVRKLIGVVDLLHFKILFLQVLCSFNISQARYQDALKNLNQMVRLRKIYPLLLSGASLAIHYLFGLLAHATRDQLLAISHFETALKQAYTVDLQALCILCLCVCYFQTGLRDKVAQLLSNSSSKGLFENSSNVLIRGCHMFVQGVVLLMQGHVSDSKNKLRECLTLATESLSNHQLAANILNVLGEIFLSTERISEAQHVILSSINLSATSLDRITLMTAVSMLSIVNQRMHDPMSSYSNAEIFNKTYQEVATEIEAAKKSSDFVNLVSFNETAIQ